MSCAGESSSAVACRALVLHRHGRHISACPLVAETSPKAVALASFARRALGGFVVNISETWLAASRNKQAANGGSMVSAGTGGASSAKGRADLYLERTVALSMDPLCPLAGVGVAPPGKNCTTASVLVATSLGRVVLLRPHAQRPELVPAEVVEEGDPVEPGAVRRIGGSLVGVLQQSGVTIQVLDLGQGGKAIGKIKIPQSQAAAAFCIGGGSVFLMGRGPSPDVWRMPLPQEITAHLKGPATPEVKSAAVETASLGVLTDHV